MKIVFPYGSRRNASLPLRIVERHQGDDGLQVGAEAARTAPPAARPMAWLKFTPAAALHDPG